MSETKTLGLEDNLSYRGEPYQQLITDKDGNAQWGNRLAYKEEGLLLDNATVTGDFDSIDSIGEFNEGEYYYVIFDDIAYGCKCVNWEGSKYLGNGRLDGHNFGKKEPFLISSNESYTGFTLKDTGSHTVTIIGEIIHKIDKRYVNGITPRYLYAKDNRIYTDPQCTVELESVSYLFEKDIEAGRNICVQDANDNYTIYLLTSVTGTGSSTEIHCGHKVFYIRGNNPNKPEIDPSMPQ